MKTATAALTLILVVAFCLLLNLAPVDAAGCQHYS